MLDPISFFKRPAIAGQKQYEALRGHFIDHVPGREAARRFGYTYAAFNSLKQRFKAGSLTFLFTASPGPKGPRVSTELRQRIIEHRRKRLSAYQIAEILETLGTPVSVSTISRILTEEGFSKLPRRTQLLIGITKDNTIVPAYASELDPKSLSGWRGTCAVGGIFLFAPLLEHFGVIDAIEKAKLPRSPDISPLNYTLSMLALKLVGKPRLSQINDFNFDKGLGLFAKLNILPKSTAISTYSYRLSQKNVNAFMQAFVQKQTAMKTYGSDTINLDFHTIQHYGEESVLGEHFAGARNKNVKGALTFFAQDCDSRCQIYVKTDIGHGEADDQVLQFVKFWRKICGPFRQTLVFDSKLTTYEKLAELDADGVTFITLRRRGKNLVKALDAIPAKDWTRITIDSPKRKYKNPLTYDSRIKLPSIGEIRQIVMKGNGREEPAFFITNDDKSTVSEVISHYCKRWRIENGIAEAVNFFNLNMLSSPILIKIHFDVVLTMIADTLYYYLAQSLRGFEKCNAEKIFRHFVDMPATIEVSDSAIHVAFPLRAHSPVLRSAKLGAWAKPISWLGNRKIIFSWGDSPGTNK
jgi:transposase